MAHAILAEERGTTQEQPPDPTQTMPFPDALLQVGWVVQVRELAGRATRLQAVVPFVCVAGGAASATAGAADVPGTWINPT